MWIFFYAEERCVMKVNRLVPYFPKAVTQFILGLLLVFCLPLSPVAAPIDEIKVLDLATAQKIGLAENPGLAAAAERVEQARQRISQAQALYWPTINARGAAAGSRMSANDAATQSLLMGGTDVDRDSEKYLLALDGSWLLFDGFSRKFSNLIAEYGEQESEQARRDGQRQLLLFIAQSYYGAQLALYNKTIAKADFDFNSRQMEEAQLSMDAGAGSLSAVLNFQVQMNNASTDMLLAERDYDLSMYGLAVLLGTKSGQMPTDLVLAQVGMVEKEAFWQMPREQLLQAAGEYRPDLLRQELSVQRADSTVGMNRAAYYPRLSVNGAVDGKRYDDTSFEGDDFGSTVSLNLSYNLFNGGGDRARIAEAKAAKREEARTLEQQKNQVTSDVQQAITKLEQSQAQLLLQRSSVKLVEQSRDLVQEGYKMGQESLARFNEVQRDLVRTQSRLALSLISLYTNRENLKSATGENLIPHLSGEK